MLKIFLVHSMRYAARHWVMSGLNVIGIALGVTVFLSVQVVNHSALESFKASVDVVAGKANLEVVADGLQFDEAAFPVVAANPHIEAATPSVEEVATLPGHAGDYLHILGVDVFTNGPLSTYRVTAGEAAAVTDTTGLDAFFRGPCTIALTKSMGERLGVKVGDELPIDTPNGVKSFKVAYLLQFGPDVVGADEHLAVMDIANVQEVFEHIGKLSRISAIVKKGVDPALVATELQAALPGNAIAEVPDRRNRQVERMIGAFQLNLTALSLVSLMVGMFLIYNTVVSAVVRRRFEIGVLRALGLSSRQVLLMFIGEALILGVLGLVLGVVLGILLAGELVGVVSKTITSLYILESIQQLFVSPWSIFASAFLSLGAVVAAALWPAREAAMLSPVEALQVGHLQDKVLRTTWMWTALGCAMMGLGAVCGWIALNGGGTWLSFGTALFALLGSAFFVPLGCELTVKLLLALRFGGVLTRLTLGQFLMAMHRNAVTVAALVTSLAMVVGISTMIYSFRTTVQSWMDRSIQADIMIAPAANLLMGNCELVRPNVETAVHQIAQDWPGCRIDQFRELKLDYRGDRVKMVAFNMDISRELDRLNFIEGDGPTAFQQAIDGTSVLVSEAFGRKFHEHVGDSVELKTPTGPVSFKIAGVYRDYTTEAGVVLVDWRRYQQIWKDAGINGLAIYLAKGDPVGPRQAAIKATISPMGEYIVKSNRELRGEVIRIFDQTFSVTYILETIGIVVSTLGVCLSLTILVAERRREISVLRAVGGTRGQIIQIVLGEAALIGSVASVMGLSSGLILAWILSNVINVSFFGWTITWATPWGFLLMLPPIVVAGSMLAGYGPARQASRFGIAEGLKME